MWTLQTADAVDGPVGHSSGSTRGGRLTYSNGTVVTSALGSRGPEITIADTGRFTLVGDEGVIEHLAPTGVDRAAVALDLIGVVLPFALHRDGAWCIHASAVQFPDGVVAFVAPRGTGKSTLATSCVQLGYALVADDVVVMRQTGDGITVTPSGLPIRLRAETARAVGADADDVDVWGKVRVAGPVASADVPLVAVYVLTPVRSDAAVERIPRATRAAALALLTNGKITELLGGDAGGEALTRCVALAHATSVYDLAVPRDLSRLGDVTDLLATSHGGPAAT